jgi:hypothetical protein
MAGVDHEHAAHALLRMTRTASANVAVRSTEIGGAAPAGEWVAGSYGPEPAPASGRVR